MILYPKTPNEETTIKYLKINVVILLMLLLASCSGRKIQILDENAKVVGECYAGVDWHFYGMQDTIDYMLYECAKEPLASGYTISDETLLELDFTLPLPPSGYDVWNKKIAMQQYRKNNITEQKLGYILAAIEWEYQKVVWPAEDDLHDGKITQEEFDRIEKRAKFIWQGK